MPSHYRRIRKRRRHDQRLPGDPCQRRARRHISPIHHIPRQIRLGIRSPGQINRLCLRVRDRCQPCGNRRRKHILRIDGHYRGSRPRNLERMSVEVHENDPLSRILPLMIQRSIAIQSHTRIALVQIHLEHLLLRQRSPIGLVRFSRAGLVAQRPSNPNDHPLFRSSRIPMEHNTLSPRLQMQARHCRRSRPRSHPGRIRRSRGLPRAILEFQIIANGARRTDDQLRRHRGRKIRRLIRREQPIARTPACILVENRHCPGLCFSLPRRRRFSSHPRLSGRRSCNSHCLLWNKSLARPAKMRLLIALQRHFVRCALWHCPVQVNLISHTRRSQILRGRRQPQGRRLRIGRQSATHQRNQPHRCRRGVYSPVHAISAWQRCERRPDLLIFKAEPRIHQSSGKHALGSQQSRVRHFPKDQPQR